MITSRLSSAPAGPSLRSPRRWVRATATALVAALGISLAALTGTGVAAAATVAPPPAGTSYPALGTLGTTPEKAPTEYSAGVRSAMLEISWRSWEPQDGVFNAAYESYIKSRLAQLRASGMKVSLGLGLHFTPDWVKNMPNGRFVNQNGQVSAEANLVFNSKIRSQGWGFLQRVGQVLDLSQVDSIRITSGARSELLYPSGNTYWAFDTNAQNGADLPATIDKNPFPGWKPGTPGLTAAQAKQWALWYVDALSDVGQWQMRAMRKVGFTGTFQILTPGVGVYARKIDVLAAQNLPSSPLGVGALWDRVYADMYSTDRNIAAMVSSMADGSGGNDLCTTSDRSLPLTDMGVTTWGGTRWISRIADEYGIAKVGENPGYSAATAAKYTDLSENGYMATAMRQGASCGFSTVYWAHDNKFWDGTIDLSNWAAYAAPTT
ncbi:hypothetical protein FDO65_14255 [Nakamurella flava]|uniref:Glycoside hydrolase family 42 N-terminal domain-containing protein n=1 Tax=Nakamurella flava TaxID=2576308 RepID=A0A4U6QF72_9ACTN|nr:hypothetical protein [Nakamurella flava]TKV58682.1 hypothetical protein FDO65_14255 [Nakamurella flava]